MRLMFHLWVILIAIHFLTACGRKAPDSTFVSNSDASLGVSTSSAQIPPGEYYDALFTAKLRLFDNPGENVVGAHPTLFINFDGGTVKRGYAVGQSFLVCADKADIPASSLTGDQREAVIQKLQEIYMAAGVNLEISDSAAGAEATTVFVGGSYASLGCGNKSNLGAAPRDFGNANKQDVAFAFPGKNFTTVQIATLIAHVSGITFGLEQTENLDDIMSSKFSGTAKAFAAGKVIGSTKNQDGPSILRKNLGSSGSSFMLADDSTTDLSKANGILTNIPANLAGLPGLNQIAGVSKMIAALTPEQTLDVTAVVADLPKLLPAGIQAPSIEKVITVIAATQNAAIKQAQNNPKSTVHKVTEVVMSLLGDQSISTISDIASIAGFGSAGAIIAAVKLAGTIILGLTEPTEAERAALKVNVMPNFAQVIGVAPTSMTTLLNQLEGHSEIIASNFSGEDRSAMASFLKVAYAQAYATIKPQISSGK